MKKTVIKPIKMTPVDRDNTKGTEFPNAVRLMAAIWTDLEKRSKVIKYLRNLK